MLTSSDLHTLLENRRKELGMSHMQLGQKAFGRDDASTLHNIKRGSSPTYERLAQIVEALGWQVTIGPRRSTGLSEPVATTDFNVSSGLRAGFLPIPWLAPAFGATPSPVALHATYLEGVGLDIERLRAISPDEIDLEGAGKARGHVAIIDPSAPRRGMAVWAYRLGEKCVLARVAFEGPAAMILLSDKSVAPRLIMDVSASEVNFLGTVCLLIGQPA